MFLPAARALLPVTQAICRRFGGGVIYTRFFFCAKKETGVPKEKGSGACAPAKKNRYQIKAQRSGFDLKRRSDGTGERRALARRERSQVRDDDATRI